MDLFWQLSWNGYLRHCSAGCRRHTKRVCQSWLPFKAAEMWRGHTRQLKSWNWYRNFRVYSKLQFFSWSAPFKGLLHYIQSVPDFYFNHTSHIYTACCMEKLVAVLFQRIRRRPLSPMRMRSAATTNSLLYGPRCFVKFYVNRRKHPRKKGDRRVHYCLK